MTREQRATRVRLHQAVCQTHGFGRTSWGKRQLETHIECVARVVDEAKSRSGAESFPATGPAQEVTS